MDDIVIIGAGECGVRAAFTLRKLGFEGRIVLFGAETMVPYERPPLSKAKAPEHKPIAAREAFEEAQIDLRLGVTVRAIDTRAKTVTLEEGASHSYGKLLIATGARARLFPGMDDCLTLRTHEDAETIMRHVEPAATIGIVGGGFIGLELAATAVKAGADVTVIEAGPRILGRAVPEEIARLVHERHAAEGVTLLTGTGVETVRATGVTLSDGREFCFDKVIAGVGALPNTALAEDAGLDVENGIVVDGSFQASAKDVYAAGDCCRFPWRGTPVRLESWKAAQDQGTHVAEAMMGTLAPYEKVPWFWSDQYDLTLQVAGLFDPRFQTRSRGAGAAGDTHIVFQCDTAGKLVAAAGIGPGNTVAKDIKLFEKLIEKNAPLDPDALADPSHNLKTFLKAA
ncbi:FAD-dependent oxidoreductase [Jiella sp. MQZ9-1]|uniref:FAD-dependent oxidoreductase n=1 Tax=Jiella flava TaxID=2816857 RepID=A0A939JXN4_9HYPH|nr:FAD-dependent oxidoreductase [Jiella flava]MBO0664267.1 FAD-dependent oxidoreductase [Jiella flava]MCD2472810.1 FAD-dependent oxidoreductase [Jiella flava]